MTAGPARLRVLVVAAAIAGAHRAAAAPGLVAEPAVQVIGLDAGGSTPGSGTIVLRNTDTTAVVAGSITAEPGCDAQVHASPLTGFTLGAGATRTLAISCAPAPAGMQRCSYQVRSPASAVLLELEAVCAYGSAIGLSADATAIDLGAVTVGGTASRPLVLSNTAAAPIDELFVETTDLAGNFAIAAPCNPDARECDAPIRGVAAGGTTRAVVSCTPRAAGPLSAQLHLVTSAGTRLAAPIALTCTGTPAAVPVPAVSPGSIDAGSVEVVTATAAAAVHVTNTGAGSLKLLAVQILDGGTGAAADWTVTPRAPCTTQSPLCSLGNSQAADLDVVFDPGSIGVRDATLLIHYRDTADRSLSIPLHGVGSGPTLDLVAAPRILDLGALPVGTAGAVTLAIANHGTRNLGDATVTLKPAGAPFTVAPGPSFAVTTAAPTPLTVTCTPASAGSFLAELQLSAPDVQAPPPPITLRCTGDPAATLVATPPAIVLGEVRIGTSRVSHVGVASTAAPAMLTAAALETAITGLTVRGTPATTPATLDLTAAPQAEGPLDDRITVTPSTGPPLAIPITGSAVAASYSVPAAVSLGTFCVQQPTTPRILALSSTGSATLGLSAPALQSADSPFDLGLVAPLAYPGIVAPRQRAIIAATAKRRDVAGLVSDDVIWTTDVAGATTAHTTLTATFVSDGGAVAPDMIAFGATAIHVDTRNSRQVTLQNCSSASLRLDTPQVPAPFSIDSPSFPSALNPGEIATFSIGFHPTKLGRVTKTLSITSPQLQRPLTVELSGDGVAPGTDGDAGLDTPDVPSTSFYACGGCTTTDPSGALALLLAALAALAPRRRRPRSRCLVTARIPGGSVPPAGTSVPRTAETPWGPWGSTAGRGRSHAQRRRRWPRRGRADRSARSRAP
ncbi:MAG TPA: choice-of-anchor D domain-containing protein [Kofleriaceae bacterium]